MGVACPLSRLRRLDTPLLLDYVICLCLVSTDERERGAYMESVNAVVGIVRHIDRSNLFEDVIDMYREGEIVGEYPIFVEYKGEKGYDDGGVRRDMFTGF